VYSDNGTEFTSNIEEEFSKLLGIEWKYTASHSPHSNGSCERNLWTVDRKFVKDTQGRVDLQRCLARAIFATNTTVREDTNFSLTQILPGRAPRVPCFLKSQEDKEEHNTEHTCHTSTSHDTRESLLDIHETRASYRHARTLA
jgi:transposase InsO family protein